MIHFEEITNDNLHEVLALRVKSEQISFVANNSYSLSQAFVNQPNARPYAIVAEDQIVGFIMTDYDLEERSVCIWRFMIDEKYQNCGYGKETIRKIIEETKLDKEIDYITLDYEKENLVAEKLYKDFGFKETGRIEDGEIVLNLELVARPRFGILTADEEDIEEINAWIEECKDCSGFPRAIYEKINNIEELINQNQVKKITLFGKMVGLSYRGALFLSPSIKERTKEAKLLLIQKGKKESNVKGKEFFVLSILLCVISILLLLLIGEVISLSPMENKVISIAFVVLLFFLGNVTNTMFYMERRKKK